MASQHNAFNLAQGFPDFDGPDIFKEAAIEAIRKGRNQYAPSIGVPELRQALASLQNSFYRLNYDPDTETTIFSGATEALFCSIMALCEPEDEVICFAPFYESYPATVMAAQAKFKAVNLLAPNWDIDFDELKSCITKKTKLLILNTPHNPTGKVFSRYELEQIAEIANNHNLILVTDEVYEQLVYDDSKHICPATIESLKERTICISSTSKTFSFTGWKIGYAFAPRHLSRLIRIPHQYTVFCSATPLQWGMSAILSLAPNYYQTFKEDYQKRRDQLIGVLHSNGFACQKPKGSYFIMADYRQISDEKDDQAFADHLLKDRRVASIPMSGFYTDKENIPEANRYFLRFAFCKDKSTIEAANKALQKTSKNRTVK